MENTQYKGQLTEQKCFVKCLEAGYLVSKPLFDNARYDFILDTGDAPLVLEELLHNSGNNSKWRGPYYSGSLPPGGNYRRTAPGKYDFFIPVNGKPIREDVLL